MHYALTVSLCSAKCALYILHFAACCMVWCSMHLVHCTMQTAVWGIWQTGEPIHYALGSVHCSLCTVWTMHCTFGLSQCGVFGGQVNQLCFHTQTLLCQHTRSTSKFQYLQQGFQYRIQKYPFSSAKEWHFGR